jgi:mannosylglycerate hydrolase
VRHDGTFDVTDKRTGQRHAGLGALESGGDRGDEYTFCPPEEDTIVSTRGLHGEIARVESGPLRATFEVTLLFSLPARLDPSRSRRAGERRVVPVSTRISLGARRARVEVRTNVNNTVEDQRLRAVFPVDVRADIAHAGGQFSVDARPIDMPSDPPGTAEPSQPTWAHRAFVDVHDARAGLAVSERGTPEHEVCRTARGAQICLTLLRCVGYLSRGDLHTRPGDAGGGIATPEAQCPGTHSFEYAVLPHAGSWLEAGAHQDVESYLTPVRSGPVAKPMRPKIGRELELRPDELVFTALKRSEDGAALILRAFNVSDRAVTARLVLGWDAAEVRVADLAERPAGPSLRASGGGFETSVGPRRIVTFRIVP